MAATRFIGDNLTRRFGPAALTRAFGWLTALGIGLAIGTASIPGALVGYALAGIGTSVIVPLVFSAAGRWPGRQPAVTLATVSSTAYISFLLGPPLIGFVAEFIHLRWALVLIAACGLLTASLSRFMLIGEGDHYSVASATVVNDHRQVGAVVERRCRANPRLYNLLCRDSCVLINGMHRAHRVLMPAAVGEKPRKLLHRPVRRDPENPVRVGDHHFHARGFEIVFLVFLPRAKSKFPEARGAPSAR